MSSYWYFQFKFKIGKILLNFFILYLYLFILYWNFKFLIILYDILFALSYIYIKWFQNYNANIINSKLLSEI